MKTPCQCQPQSFPFECSQHKCNKTQHWWSLCQTRLDYFQLWEDGHGPGQSPPAPQEPNLLRKAINFGKAIAKHVATGRKVVDEKIYETRLAICRVCPSLDQERNVCREKACGCFVERKAKWASQQCPLNKWLAIPDDEGECGSGKASELTDIPTKSV